MTELEKNIQSYFGVIEGEDLDTISSFFSFSTLRKNDFFLEEGKPCDKLSFVQSGYLRVFKASEDKEVTQWISSPGYFIADLSSLLFETPARWTIQALTNASLYTISKEDYEKLGVLLPKWHELEKLFIAKCFTSLEDRIHNHLSMDAEQRYNYFFKNNKELFNQVPLQYIASMLGMTPETLSRLRRKETLIS